MSAPARRYELRPSAHSADMLRIAVWSAAIAVLAATVLYYAVRANSYDLWVITSGVDRFLHHQTVYFSSWGRYAFPPSSLVLLAPLGLVGFDHLRVPYLLLETVAIAAGVLLSLRLLRIEIASVRGGAALLLAGISAPVIQEIRWSNVDGLLFPMVVGALIAIDRRKDSVAGVLLGLALAFKPTAVTLLIVPLLWGRWRTLIVAATIPAVLFVAGSALLARPLDFITVTVPILLSGLGKDVAAGNVSLPAVGAWIHAPAELILLVRIVVLGVAVVAVARSRDSKRQSSEALVLLTGLVLVTADLITPITEIRYLIYLTPALAWLLLVRRGVPGVFAALGLVCWLVPYSSALDAHHWWLQQLDLFRFTLGIVLVFCALADAALQREARVTAVTSAAAV